VNVLVADDHKQTREAIADLIDRQEDLHVVGKAADGHEAVGQAQALRPDVVVMDLAMPGLHGMDATATIRATCPDIRVLVLSNHVGQQLVKAALDRGASGYIRKDRAHEELITGLRTIRQGNTFIGEAVS
jgi:DNA-binding NarL/FixJ family response regulator